MAEPKGLLIIERILRDRDGVWRQIADDHRLKSLSGQMLAASALALACYGAVLGASNGWLQALSSAVKLPLLFLVTMLICLPTLYLFNLVFGARLSIRQALALVSTAITVIAMLSLAFAPISLFFLITAPHYNFYKVLNVTILALTGLVGLRFLIGGMRSLNRFTQAQALAAPPAAAETEPATTDESAEQAEHSYYTRPQPTVRSANIGLLYVWVIVFGFVGTQMAWTLRPFLGSPEEPFEVFRTIEGNFYVDVVKTIGRLLGAG